MSEIKNDLDLVLPDVDTLRAGVQGSGRIFVGSVGNLLYGDSRKLCNNVRRERELRGRLLIVAKDEQTVHVAPSSDDLGASRTPHAMRTCKNNIRTLLPRREAALAKLEHDLGPINDTLNIGLCERT